MDTVVGCSDSEANESGADGDSVVGVAADSCSEPARKRIRARRPPPTDGVFGVWLTDGPGYKPVGVGAAGSDCLPDPAARPNVVGLGVCDWKIVLGDVHGEGDGGGDPAMSVMAPDPPQTWGHILYSISQCYLFSEPETLPDNWDAAGDTDALGLAKHFETHTFHKPEQGNVATVIDFCYPTTFDQLLHVPMQAVLGAYNGNDSMWKRVRLGTRVGYSQLLPNLPPRSSIQRWRAEAGAARLRPVAADPLEAQRLDYERVLLELPGRRQSSSSTSGAAQQGFHRRGTAFDPIRLVLALGFATFLKRTTDFAEAHEACKEYDHYSDEEERRPMTKVHPGDATLRRAKARLDVVGMLFDRREIHALLATKQIRSITINTDASPVVGLELQGVVVDLMLVDDSKKQVVCPGATLTYGHYDVVNKTVAALHSLWLIGGPTVETLQQLCSLVVGITTDHGVEIQTINMPDVTEAFVRWLDGEPLEATRHYVRYDRRLFPNAVRISGWSHAFGNIMKATAQSCPSWPDILTALRDQVSFWREQSWRKHVAKVGQARGMDTSPLKSFGASFAKWRYETIAAVTKALSKVRPFAETIVVPEMFIHAQDREKVHKATTRCRDSKLQKFISVTYSLLWKPLESGRRWGMTCECKEHVESRQAGTLHISCPRNGRKLRWAWDFVNTMAFDFETNAADLTEDMCEGDHDLYVFLHDMLLQAATSLRLRFKYLGNVPWKLACADEVSGAKDCVEQIKSKPLVDHDPLTQRAWALYGDDLEQRALGGPLTPALKLFVDRMNDVGLDESAGEGWHRSTNHEHCRARAAKHVHLKRAGREKQNVRRLKKFMRDYGDRGKAVVSFEWTH